MSIVDGGEDRGMDVIAHFSEDLPNLLPMPSQQH